MRPAEVYVHSIGTDQKQDRLVYSEKDERYFLDVKLSKDHTHILINSNSKSSSEIHAIDLRVSSPLFPSIFLISPRSPGLISTSSITKIIFNYMIFL